VGGGVTLGVRLWSATTSPGDATRGTDDVCPVTSHGRRGRGVEFSIFTGRTECEINIGCSYGDDDTDANADCPGEFSDEAWCGQVWTRRRPLT